MLLAHRIAEFLKRLTPLTRNNLLNELERLELCGVEMPGVASVLEPLRAEFRQAGKTHERLSRSSRFFFAPLEPFLVDADPDYPNPGRMSRGSLPPIWEWISRDLLPTMARDYVAQVSVLLASDRYHQAGQVTGTFQTKVIKSLENTLRSPEAAQQVRAKLASYTASHSVFGDLTKMACVLRARDALAKLDKALPETLSTFDDERVAAITTRLDAFARTSMEAVPYALTLVANRLRTPWQLIRLATKAARTKDASDVAATPYAVAVTIVLDRLEDKKLALRAALKNERVLVAKQLLREIYETEYALQVRIDQLDQSELGARLHAIMNGIAALVDAEVARFPPDIGHVLGSRSLRTQNSLSGRLTYLAWKGRDAMQESAAFCKKLIGQT